MSEHSTPYLSHRRGPVVGESTFDLAVENGDVVEVGADTAHSHLSVNPRLAVVLQSIALISIQTADGTSLYVRVSWHICSE